MENQASSHEKARSLGTPRTASSDSKSKPRNDLSRPNGNGGKPSMSARPRKRTQRSENETKTSKDKTEAKPICEYYAKTGTCRFGENCRFSHDVNKESRNKSAASSSTPSSRQRDKHKHGSSAADFVPICRAFEKTGKCKYGQNCRFSHKVNNASNRKPRHSASFSTPTPQASMDVTHFIQRIENIVRRPNASLRLEHQHDLDLWKQSWSAVGVGAELSSAGALLTMLMRLPASSLFLPPTSDLVRTLARVGQHVAAENISDKMLLKRFELIADVYEHRLLGQEATISASLRSTCIDKTAELRSNIHTGLIKAIGNPHTAQRASKLLIRSLTLFDRFISDLQRCEEGQEEENVRNDKLDSWSGWRNATVGWLQRASWLNASQLHNEYESVEHYAETLRALMTALTFFWGAGALLPKCRVRKDGANACDQPLHVQIRSNNNQLCGQKLPNRQTCTQKATWRCVRHGHDRICNQCLRRTQETLVGEPSPRASTDIYDAVVERETTRRDGLVYIASKLESRRPPAITPNWKTTYRLNCSALVGVVRLGASCEPLSSESRVEWAEIVPLNPHTGPLSDFQERARGRIALRLLTRADLSTLGGTWEALRPGARIAVIDTQVFVPEVVSVLSALTDPGLVDHMHHIQFWPQLIGTSRAGEIRNPGSNVSDVVKYALDNTQMDVIHRLEPSAKARLCQRITNLARQTNLSGTQLEAFAASLSNSLHCTQGPPGTGKSYLGVVLIRALDLIRKSALHSGIAVGPIVVLSYKNHALDEILGDLVDTRQWSGAIIRCGKTGDPRIASSMERKSVEERKAQSVLTERVAVMRRTRRFMREIRALSSAFGDETGVSLQSWKSSWKSIENDQSEIATRWVLQMLRFFLFKKRLDNDITDEEAYKLLRRTIVSESDIGIPSVHDYNLLAMLQGLQKGTEHWFEGQTNQTYFLLSKWLSGSKPPPRCVVDGCLFASERVGAFCKESHGCLIRGCGSRRVNEFFYCDGHRCKYDSLVCKEPRMEGADVCPDHACVYCLEHGIIPVSPRIGAACKNHSCRDNDCAEVFLAPILPFCTRHCCRVCHHYASSNPEKVRSVHRIEFSQFCAEHKCSVQGCIENRDLRDDLQQYCVYHSCVACNGIREVIDFALPESRLCAWHRCSSILYGRLCDLQREENSVFCTAHTCRFCREERLPLDTPVIDSEPRNACSNHKLCENLSFGGETCNERVCSSNSKYCEKHLKRSRINDGDRAGAGTKMKCEGTTTKGKRCGTIGLSLRAPYYCAPHIAQKPDSESESETEDEHHTSDEQEQSLPSEDCKDREPDAELLDRCPEDFWSAIQPQQPENGAPAPLVLGEANVEATSVKNLNEVEPNREENEARMDRHEIKSCTELKENVVLASSKTANVVPSATGPSYTEKTGPDVMEVEKVVIAEELNPELKATEGSALPDNDGEIKDKRDTPGSSQDELNVAHTESESEEEIPDQMRHLRDIVDIDSDSGSDSDVEDSFLPLVSDGLQDESTSAVPDDWHWGLLLPARWRYVSSFLGAVLADISELAEIADTYIETSRRELSEAAAYSFKNAQVIGATVVGATRRLHALRASEPFAMIVEEACEVLEPTLVSVLSVRSLRKLELIGDHRQLPAYVQPCWFSVQVANPSIKVSLFERLVLNDPSSCTVLDVQRRMRPFICDLTRCEYEDIVQIEDFANTKTQLIGDKLIDFTFSRRREIWQAEERDLWAGKGSVVPGVKPQVFFWDLQTKEGRAAVGLSRCNYGEAKACVALAHWLVYCGVPPGSITIITPYKGQKLTITHGLRGVSDERLRRVFVSTVDRYQGDENDIVILSLVSTRAGNRFVALRNRFIVSLSRARIGLYVIGSSEAVSKDGKGGDGPSHWCRLLRDLRDNEHTNSGLGKAASVPLRNIGPQLSICCPRHTDVNRCIVGADEFPTGADDFKSFCNKPCQFILPWCGHTCELPCHPLKEATHRADCSVKVPRPCQAHIDVPLHCHEVKLRDVDSSNLSEGLEAFECDVPVLYPRPECSHSVEMKCNEHQRIQSGEVSLQECSEQVDDYVNPSCGHKRKKPKCYHRRMWEKEPPSCHVLVAHERPCGCKTRMSCEESVKELALENPPTCLEAVAKPRPRCSHILSSRCFEATALRESWSQQEGEAISSSPPIVLHGVQYGPSETEIGRSCFIWKEEDFPPCLMKTKYRRSCGHTMVTRCDDAFQLANGDLKEGLCREEVLQVSPLCGHEINTACHFRPVIESQPPSLFVTRVVDAGNTETIADESAIENAPPFPPGIKKLGSSCGGSFVVQRKCGHKTNKLFCSELYSLFRTKRLPPCEEKVNLKMLCGHSYTTMCHRQGEPYPDCNEPVEDMYVYSSCRRLHSVRPGVCGELQKLRALENPQCPVMITSTRSRCSHKVEVPCHLEKLVTSKLPGSRVNEAHPVVQAGVEYCDPAVGINPCHEPVAFRRLCGHEEANVPCSGAFEWAADPQLAPPCRVIVEMVSPLCQHVVNIECCLSEVLSSLTPWVDATPSRINVAFDGREEYSSPMVIEGRQEPNGLFDIAWPDCIFTTRLQRACGHEEDVKCNNIFTALETPCEQTEIVKCDECGHDASVPCHKLGNESDPYLCHAVVEKMCSICQINTTKVECFMKKSNCARQVFGELPCGHKVRWTCGEEDPRRGFKSESCLFCVRESYNKALDSAQALKSKMQAPKSSLSEGEKGSSSSRETCGFSGQSLLESLIQRVKDTFPAASIISFEQLGDINEEALISAQIEILEYHVDLYTEAIKSGEISVEELEVQQPPRLSDALKSYDIVYAVVKENDSATDWFRMRDCQYGFGTTVSILCEDAVAEDYSKGEGVDAVSVIVAAVLKLRGLKGVDPFRPPRAELEKQKRRKVTTLLKKARRKGKATVKLGYDHVHVVGNPYGRVYWIPEAVVPIAKMKVQPMRVCQICFDDVLPVKGWVCSEDHFLCRDCFNGHVKAAKAPDALARAVDGEGHILCPHAGCESKFDTLQLLGQKHDASEEELREVFTSLQALRMERHTTREVQAALQEQKVQLKAEFDRIQQIEDGHERRAEQLRLTITDEILTLRCPRKKCRTAFIDFEGCFALTCANSQCRMEFCAWCLGHRNGSDMHQHVANCQQRPAGARNSVYQPLRVFQEHHRQRRAKLIEAKLGNEDRRVRKRTLELLQQELSDLGIRIRT